MSVRFTLESGIIIGHRKKNQLCSAESVGMSNMYLDKYGVSDKFQAITFDFCTELTDKF